MSVARLALSNIKASRFRSLVIFLCVLGAAASLIAATLIIRGAEYSLNLGIEKLGADIMVVPEGADMNVETALLMGRPAKVLMDKKKLAEIARIPGVEHISPQLYLKSLYAASCCSVSETFLVVYEPETDFTIRPWLEANLGHGLGRGEVIGGSNIFVPPGEEYIRLYGYNLVLRGNIESTGTGIDQTIFFTLETARDIAQSSVTTAESPLEIPPDAVSSVMVKVAPGADRHGVALQMMLDIAGVTPLESPNLFGQFRQQITGLLWGFVSIMLGFWALAAVMIGLVFSLAASQRRRDIAVLRALGATRGYILRSVLAEAAMLAAAGGSLGIAAGALGVYSFRGFITASLGMPFLFPDPPSFLALVGTGAVVIMGTVFIAALSPALRMSRQEPALAVRE